MNVPSTGVAGVMISLWLSVAALEVVVVSMRLKVAGTPLTVTVSMLNECRARLPLEPWKSKENDDRGAPVVAASIVVVAAGTFVVRRGVVRGRRRHVDREVDVVVADVVAAVALVREQRVAGGLRARDRVDGVRRSGGNRDSGGSERSRGQHSTEPADGTNHERSLQGPLAAHPHVRIEER